jgi:Tfp pilus assembly protein PilN
MRAVNLLPKEETPRRRKTTNWAAVVGLAGAAVLAAALGAALLQAKSTVSERQDRLAAASAELAAMPVPKPVSNSAAALAGERDRRAAAVASAFTYHVPWDRMLRRFALVLPDDVWLTSLTAKAPKSPGETVSSAGTTPGSAPSGFTISGYTYSHDGVARLISRLAVLPDLKDVQLQTSTLTKIGERPVVQFTILADVRAGGGSS